MSPEMCCHTRVISWNRRCLFALVLAAAPLVAPHAETEGQNGGGDRQGDVKVLSIPLSGTGVKDSTASTPAPDPSRHDPDDSSGDNGKGERPSMEKAAPKAGDEIRPDGK